MNALQLRFVPGLRFRRGSHLLVAAFLMLASLLPQAWAQYSYTTIKATPVHLFPEMNGPVFAPPNGTITGAPGNFYYVPAPEFSGRDFFLYFDVGGFVSSVEINVLPDTSWGQADAGPDREIDAGEEVVFLSGFSRPLDPEQIGFSWDFGDGTGSLERNPSHIFSGPGTYTVTLSVSWPGQDEPIGVDTATVTVLADEELSPYAMMEAALELALPYDAVKYSKHGRKAIESLLKPENWVDERTLAARSISKGLDRFVDAANNLERALNNTISPAVEADLLGALSLTAGAAMIIGEEFLIKNAELSNPNPKHQKEIRRQLAMAAENLDLAAELNGHGDFAGATSLAKRAYENVLNAIRFSAP